MKPSEIISLARRQTWCTEDIVTKAEAYKFLNFVNRRLCWYKNVR